MKVINYNQKNKNYLSAFDCVIYGYIEMTPQEWKDACTYLKRAIKDKFYKKLLCEDIDREDINLSKFYSRKCIWRNVRVTATELLFKKYNLPRYKRQNYAIRIK